MEVCKQQNLGSMQAAELWKLASSKHASSRTMEACKQQNYGSMRAVEHELPSHDVSSALQYDRPSAQQAVERLANDHLSWSARSGPVRSAFEPVPERVIRLRLRATVPLLPIRKLG